MTATDDISAQRVRVEDKGAVRVLTMNRPEKRNAIDLAQARALAQALDTAINDEQIRAVVLTGAETTFCSGGDISTMGHQSSDLAQVKVEASERVVRTILECPKPVLAAVEGQLFGAGVGLAVACDRVVAASDSTFTATFTGVGLSGDAGIFVSLPRRVGLARARQMLMLPITVPADEALSIGLVDSVVAPGATLEAAISDGQDLASGPPLALAAIKVLLNGWTQPHREVIDQEVATMTKLFQSEDHAEGAAAFFEKRQPTFRGR